MARKRIIIEDMVSGQQKTLECEGYLVCTFNDQVDLGDDKSAYGRASVLAEAISAGDVARLMTVKGNPLEAAWKAMKKLQWRPGLMRKLRESYEEYD